MRKSNHGFSLTELLIVIGIMAVLAGLGVATMGKSRVNTQTATTKALIKNLYVAIEAYKQEVGYYPEPQSNYFISNNNSGGNQILKDSKVRKYFTFTDNDLENDKLIDSFGTPLIYMYKDDVTNRYFVDDAINAGSNTVIYTSNAADRHVIDLPSDMTHEIFIFSVGSDSKDDTDKEADTANDIYTASAD